MLNKISLFLKKNYNIILVFIISFLIYNFFGFYSNNGDPIASYGFSHAIVRGEIPYVDFNTISTPVYMFYNSLFLLVYDDFFMFLLAQTVLVTLMFYFLFKLFGNKSWIVFLAMVFFKFMGFGATYNLCCLFFSVVVLYMEKNHSNKDFLIGIFLALCFLSKQTVGGLFVIPSLIICFNDFKRLLKRIGGFFVPCFVLFVYLICTNSLYQFIDLCFLGLFDFGGNNNVLFTIWFFLSFVLFFINILFVIRDRDILDYYGFCYFGFVLPIFDLNHFAYYLAGFSIVLINHIKEFSFYKKILIWGLIFQFVLFNYLMGVRFNSVIVYNLNHFKYRYNYKVDYMNLNKMFGIIDIYKEYDPILIMYCSMTYNIINDLDINYFDIFLYGNHGYDGTQKMIDKINMMSEQYFIINMDEYDAAKVSDSQFNVDIIDYIVSVSNFVKSYGNISVYYKE